MKKVAFLAILLLIANQLDAQRQARTSIQKNDAPTSESYQSFTFNGSWCWFSDPRAVYYEGTHKRTYSGWVDNYGDIHVAWYDHETGETHSSVIIDNLEIDDHNNPSLLFDEDGKLMVFFNTHMIGVKPLYLIKSSQPESIDDFVEIKELFLNDPELADMGSLNHTYTNPVKLSAENGRIYLFWRGIDGKPSYSFSDDNGEIWANGKILFMPDPIYNFRRPYTKVYSNGVDKIHFVVTDGHPRNEQTNSIYYFYYHKGALYKADGSMIKQLSDGPVAPTEADLVYNAETGNAKAWNWDIAADEAGNPVIAYVKFPDDENHIYCYARYHRGEWNNYELVNSGKWFPETFEGETEPEPNYSGGMSIDHENPNVLYLSVNRDSVFEIEKWTTQNLGRSWNVEFITQGSEKDNVRPFAVRNAGEGNPVQVLWMQNTRYHYFAYGHDWIILTRLNKGFRERFHSSIQMNIPSTPVVDTLSKKGIVDIMHRTADWQLANPFYRASELDWHYGAFYTGLRALSEMTGENRYINEMYNVGQAHDWKIMDDIFHADRLTIIDNWIWLYTIYNEPQMIDKARWAFDIHLARDYDKITDVRFADNPSRFEWWTWCDALFMAPPSFAEMTRLTGEEKYLDYALTQWWKTSDYLYSKDDSLYFRDDRFFDQLSENGKKIFWSRGNGWVLAGLARMLEDMPEDHQERARLEQQYMEMAHKILDIQDEDGLWRVSLIDPEYLNMGESSGSSFYTFALAWGINNGLLDETKYKSQVEKAWKALCGNVNEEGRLGYVQQVAGDPYPFYEHEWQVYATGAFLLAGSEMVKMVGGLRYQD